MSSTAHQYTSYDDARRLEEESGIKHEWWDGVAVAMAGGSAPHSAVASSVQRHLGNALDGTPCFTYTSDFRIRSKVTGVLTYADVSVVCGPREPHPGDSTASTNPTVVAEVLSPSTEAYDRGRKLEHYMGIDSVRHILLLSADGPRVEHYQRTDLAWIYIDHRSGDTVSLAAIGVDLSVDDIYANLPPEPPSTA